MEDQAKSNKIHEYSDDDIVFDPPPESELDDIEADNNSNNMKMEGSPNDKKYIFLGNPKLNGNTDDSKYSLNYYYCNENNNETIHIFRTINPETNNSNKYFPTTEYIDKVQKIRGESMIKLVDYNEQGKWIHFEYIPGGTLYELIKYGRQVNPTNKFIIFYEIATTIDELHHMEMSHLDIRLESIIITALENKPVLADTELMVHSFDTRDEYEPRYLIYLDPNIETVTNSVQADIYSYGMTLMLFLTYDIKPLSEINYSNILNAYQVYKNNEDKLNKLNTYLTSIGIDIDKTFTDNDEIELMNIAKDCLNGKIKYAQDLINRFNEIPKKKDSHISIELLGLKKKLKLDEDNYQSDEKFDFRRSSFSLIEKSASYFNAIDIWLANKRDKIINRPIQQRAARASLYSIITDDLSLYESVLKETGYSTETNIFA